MRKSPYVFGALGIVLLTAASSLPARADEVQDFISADRNGNGLLEGGEFQTFVKARASAGDSSAKWVVRFGAWGRALKTVDSNKDGKVSGDELKAYDASR